MVHLRPLDQLLRLPEAAGLTAVMLTITDSISPAGGRFDRRPGGGGDPPPVQIHRPGVAMDGPGLGRILPPPRARLELSHGQPTSTTGR